MTYGRGSAAKKTAAVAVFNTCRDMFVRKLSDLIYSHRGSYLSLRNSDLIQPGKPHICGDAQLSSSENSPVRYNLKCTCTK